MRNLFLLVFLTLFMSTVPAMSQSGVIRGKVTDARTHDPAPFATVGLEKDSIRAGGIATDVDGQYMITGIHPGSYSLICSYVGYKPYMIRPVEIHPGDTLIINVELIASSFILHEIEVVDYRTPLISKDMTSSGSSNTYNSATFMRLEDQSSFYRAHHSAREEKASSSGMLTASELNDFGKWKLWTDIQAHDLSAFQHLWNIAPVRRYPVQVSNAEGDAICDAVVKLRNRNGIVLWSAKTDNTGKAELWERMFEKQKPDKPEIVVTVNGKEYVYNHPTMLEKGINGFRIPAACSRPVKADICFVVDATGSMKDEISFLKSDLVDIIRKTREKMPELELMLGSVFYRSTGDSYVTRQRQFSADINGTENFIREQDAEEGGDEVVEEGLAAAVDSMAWDTAARARLLFLILDQPPLENGEVISSLQKTITKAAQKGIRIFPVVASAESPERAGSMEYLMRSIALATNGSYIFLTDHSRIGDKHAVPVTDEYDVELLNNLMTRIIAQCCYMSFCKGQRDSIASPDTTFFTNRKVIAHEIVDANRIPVPGKEFVNLKDFTEILAHDSLSEQVDTDSAGNTEHVKSTSDREKLIMIRIYPNPASTHITVEISGQIDELYLSDLSGKILEKFKITGLQKLDIDLSMYSSGLYFLKFRDEGRWYSGKIILMH